MTLKGLVVKGQGLGAKLGFPTANVAFDGAVPERGVWEVNTLGRRAVCNVGVRPTVDGSGKLTVEVHIPGFSGDLYGQRLTIVFVRKIREEKKFGSVEELKAQIARDVSTLGQQR